MNRSVAAGFIVAALFAGGIVASLVLHDDSGSADSGRPGARDLHPASSRSEKSHQPKPVYTSKPDRTRGSRQGFEQSPATSNLGVPAYGGTDIQVPAKGPNHSNDP